MKISQIIQQLQAIQNKEGDLDAFYQENHTDGPMDEITIEVIHNDPEEMKRWLEDEQADWVEILGHELDGLTPPRPEVYVNFELP